MSKNLRQRNDTKTFAGKSEISSANNDYATDEQKTVEIMNYAFEDGDIQKDGSEKNNNEDSLEENEDSLEENDGATETQEMDISQNSNESNEMEKEIQDNYQDDQGRQFQIFIILCTHVLTLLVSICFRLF